ncbi:helix-turn-helix transcriptional regulator [Microbacterium sp. Yaish 1]|uniref:helix-turn-helix transcriptional regulator n=1 Tax=Microbacterium sp. Yaish 1 TaxID=2025014 RepID=UPI000B940A2D|nr:hypothetical protein CI089_00165 [Microbacterium sp. Yaish 1]
MDDADERLNVRETAKRLGVHENNVRSFAKEGILPDARVPGTKFSRFRARDVERLRAQRGAVALSLAAERRTVNPELVTAGQLAQWPATSGRDCQAYFPELIRRLPSLSSSPGC